jgi:uncharacterized SAM-binding protein YcdF (DUF218 family)
LLLLVPTWLHKALPIPFLPIGLCLTLGLLALLLKKRWLGLLAVAILYVASLPPTAALLLSTVENDYPAIEVKDCPKADAIVVLCGMVHDTGGSATEWTGAVDRFERAVELAAADRAPFLVFTRGVNWTDPHNEAEGDVLAREAVKHGIAAKRIVLATAPIEETSGEMRSIRQAVEKHGWKRIILVTSAFHMPRAMWLAEHEHLNVIPFPADFRAEWRSLKSMNSALPQATYLESTELALREWIGISYYRVFMR